MKKQETASPKLKIKEITRRLAQVQGGASVVGWGVGTAIDQPDINRNLK